jgi:histidinol-phosphatase
MSTVGRDLDLALELAARADAITLARFGALDLRVAHKPDLTPVTDADEAVETALRDVLARERPGDDVFGEEQGGTARHSGRQWVIDPIDGTKNFVRGVPVWASLIALLQDGTPTVGVVSAPALGRRWWAGQGLGAHAAVGDDAPRRLEVSGVSGLGSASLSFSSLSGWADLTRGIPAGVQAALDEAAERLQPPVQAVTLPTAGTIGDAEALEAWLGKVREAIAAALGSGPVRPRF